MRVIIFVLDSDQYHSRLFAIFEIYKLGLHRECRGIYTTFIGYARKYGEGIDVEKRWREWIAFEASIIENYGKSETIHG
jgi:hypothetical protein